MKFAWADGARFGTADPQTVGERVERIRQKHEGTVRPEYLVADAKGPRSPLHDLFEWNNARAAEAHRLDQARLILRSLVTIVNERQRQPTRAFVAVRTDDDDEATPTGKAYVSIADALDDPLLREQLLHSALRELHQWRSKYARLKALADLFSAIDEQLELNEVSK